MDNKSARTKWSDCPVDDWTTNVDICNASMFKKSLILKVKCVRSECSVLVGTVLVAHQSKSTGSSVQMRAVGEGAGGRYAALFTHGFCSQRSVGWAVLSGVPVRSWGSNAKLESEKEAT